MSINLRQFSHLTHCYRPFSLLAAITVLGVASTDASADTIFVNGATVVPAFLQTGNSWAFAYKDLQDGIADSVAGDDIWVAKGTYKPTSTTDRTASFQLKNGVRMLGGFVSGAATLADRDPITNQTILSGDIGGPSTSDNSIHVVRTTAVGSNTVLAGFVITGGNANGGGADNNGGGMFNTGAVVVVDCVFVKNVAANFGGGLISVGIGGGVSTEFSNCVFEGNTAGGSAGGGADIQNGSARFFFCDVVNNSGGGIRFLNAGASSQLNSCIIRGNTGPGTVLEQQVVVANSTVLFHTNNITGGAGLGLAGIDADPKFIDPDGVDGIIGNLDDNLRLRGDSPCIDKASTASLPADKADLDGDGNEGEALPLDLAGITRRTEDPLVPNGATVIAPAPDIGAFEFNRPRTILVNLNATGANDGTTWTNAYTSLQSAIAELSDVKFGGPGEIWVAKGTYKPTTTTNQTISFQPPLFAQLYGGFVGGELARSSRNWIANPTILSGEIGTSATFDNTDIVVRYTGFGFENIAVLDGFVVTRGNGGAAGGILADNNASPTIRNCRIIDNQIGVRFSGNQAANPKLDNSIIAGNLGGGVQLTFSNATVTNCTVAHTPAPRSSLAQASMCKRPIPTFATASSSATPVAARSDRTLRSAIRVATPRSRHSFPVVRFSSSLRVMSTT